MRLLQVILCLSLYVAVASAQTVPADQRGTTTAGSRNGQPQLRLTTSIVGQRRTVELNDSFLRWTLRLTYTNMGGRPILLDKKSTLILRSMVSRSLKAAAAKKYIGNTSHSYFDLRKAGFRDGELPREDAFVTLKPGESYSLEDDGFGQRLYDGTKDSEDELHPGHYFLQLRVATWYYFVPSEEYRERWRDKGYLWSGYITSEPMPFTVEKRHAVSKP